MVVRLSWENVFELLKPIEDINNVVYGIPKGGMIAAGFLRSARITHDPSHATIILDDVIDTGETRTKYTTKYPLARFYALLDKQSSGNPEWVIFPWERDHPSGQEDSIQENIVRQLQYIGEDPKREGLKGTPDRIIRAWDELFIGYKKDPKELFTTFEGGGYSQIILLKDIELFSMCEHHMLPFFGKVHVAYIPHKHEGKVIGVSKIARLVDIYARRLQIQERIGECVVNDIMKYLQPCAAACIIEAVHMCMRMRGVSKQHSTMITSSLRGSFLDQPSARAELMQLIGG